jgi:hypothetical protein
MKEELFDDLILERGYEYAQVLNRKLYPSNNCKLYYPI